MRSQGSAPIAVWHIISAQRHLVFSPAMRARCIRQQELLQLHMLSKRGMNAERVGPAQRAIGWLVGRTVKCTGGIADTIAFRGTMCLCLRVQRQNESSYPGAAGSLAAWDLNAHHAAHYTPGLGWPVRHAWHACSLLQAPAWQRQLITRGCREEDLVVSSCGG